jgi:transcriptional regulator with XRE-family HTH domain
MRKEITMQDATDAPMPLRAELLPGRIGHRLMLLREALGLRPSEMADLLGIERTYWSRFETGKRPITMGVAALLVHRFGVTLDFIFLGNWAGVPLDLAEKMRAKETQPAVARMSAEA